jgi:hypothetical protein
MKRFKRWLLEDDKESFFRKAYSGQPQEKFLNSYMGSNPNVRKKYLPFAMSHNKIGENQIDPDTLGRAVDYYHNVKNRRGVQLHRDINTYPSHSHFLSAVDQHRLSPISNDETGFSHPDSKVVHNQNGVRISSLPTIEAALATRDSRYTSDKNLRDNSWCVTKPHDNVKVPASVYYNEPNNNDLVDRHEYNGYHNHHLVQYRDPNTGTIRHNMYGNPHYGIINDYELNDEKQKGDTSGHYLPDHVRSELYQHGPVGIKGDIRHASENELEDYIRQKGEDKFTPGNARAIIASNTKHALPFFKDIVTKSNGNIDTIYQHAAIENPRTRDYLLKIIGGSENLDISHENIPLSKPEIAHAVLDHLTPGKYLNRYDQENIMRAAEPEHRHLHRYDAPFHPQLVRRLVDTHGRHIDKRVQTSILMPHDSKIKYTGDDINLYDRNQAVRKDFVQRMGNKLDPDVVHNIVTNHPEHARDIGLV